MLPMGAHCDDGNDSTTSDTCSTDGACEGKQVLRSTIVFSTSDVELPAAGSDVATSSVAIAMKASLEVALAASLGNGINVVILGVAQGSLVVDYKVEVPSTTTINQSMKDDAIASLSMREVVLGTGDDAVNLGLPHAEAFQVALWPV